MDTDHNKLFYNLNITNYYHHWTSLYVYHVDIALIILAIINDNVE